MQLGATARGILASPVACQQHCGRGLQFGARGALLGLGFASVKTVRITDGDNGYVASNTQARPLQPCFCSTCAECMLQAAAQLLAARECACCRCLCVLPGGKYQPTPTQHKEALILGLRRRSLSQ